MRVCCWCISSSSAAFSGVVCRCSCSSNCCCCVSRFSCSVRNRHWWSLELPSAPRDAVSWSLVVVACALMELRQLALAISHLWLKFAQSICVVSYGSRRSHCRHVTHLTKHLPPRGTNHSNRTQKNDADKCSVHRANVEWLMTNHSVKTHCRRHRVSVIIGRLLRFAISWSIIQRFECSWAHRRKTRQCIAVGISTVAWHRPQLA